MKRIKQAFGLYLFLLKHNPLKSIWINFKVLPFRQAIRLPILLYSDTIFRNLSGSIIYRGEARPFVIRIGNDTCYPTTSRPLTIWDNRGSMILNGPISFIQGTYILVSEGATLEIGSKGTFLGANTKIMCFDHITIGDRVEVTWDCQFYDTSFHYVEDNNGIISNLTSPIVIHDNCWIGNRCTISKGCVLPEYSILGSGSLANKDYTENGSFCMYTGVPATVKRKDVRRVFDEKREAEQDKEFSYYRNHL